MKIYGSPKSSAGRCFWTLEECGVEYEVGKIDFRQRQHKSPEFLKLNPNGKIPVLVDGDFKLWESMAINSYLALSHAPELLGSNIKSKALVNQWSFWALAELQDPIIQVFIQLVFVPEEKRNYELVEKMQAKLPVLFDVLNTSLENKNFLVNNEFTLADLNVLSVVEISHEIKFDYSKYANITNWEKKISERAAYKKYKNLQQES